MDIRSLLNHKKEKKAKNLWIITIILIIIAFFVGIIFLNRSNYKPAIEYFIGEKISIYGQLSYDNNYPTNTHKLTSTGENFGLKSSSINLNNFLDTEVEIEGNIIEITDKYPILNISTLKIPTYKLLISDNKYFYTKDLISFDFSKDTDVYSKKTGGRIILYYQNEPILYVETFICNSINDGQNCDKMKMNYIINLNETFESTLGNTFYKNKKNSRISFNDDSIGYIFTVNNDNDMLNLSHSINIVNSDFLKIHKKDVIISECSNDDIELKAISNIEKGIIDDDLIKLSITGKTTEGKQALCKLNIDIFQDWNIVNKSLSISE